ncbi:MAG: helix-turn-helix domain-containing protein [Firmicutes bacterium]|nr:helix-turn-helix domain-containing protein [Bacillota bacterium]
MSKDRRIIGRRLAQTRHRAGLSQQTIATYLGRPRRWVAQVEHGRIALSLSVLDQLSALYGCSVDALLKGTAGSHVPLGHIRPGDLSHIAFLHRLARNLDDLNGLLSCAG